MELPLIDRRTNLFATEIITLYCCPIIVAVKPNKVKSRWKRIDNLMDFVFGSDRVTV
jgi:hypothetical protein